MYFTFLTPTRSTQCFSVVQSHAAGSKLCCARAWTHRGVVPDVVSAGRTFRAIAFCRLQLWPRVFQESLCNRLASHAGNVYTCLQQWDRSSWDSSSTLAGTSALPDFPTQTRNPSELHHSPFFASDSYINDANPIEQPLSPSV